MGSLSKYVGDGKGKVKKGIGLMNKTSVLHVNDAFLYISSPSLYDYNAKLDYPGSRGPFSKYLR